MKGGVDPQAGAGAGARAGAGTGTGTGAGRASPSAAEIQTGRDASLSAAAIQAERDAAELRRLGYAQQLLRQMGGFANFALSFSIISILTGAVTLYGHGLRFGGPLVMGLGWPLVTLLTLPIALSLAELASAYPTAGALYHWSAWLGGRGWGFLTAWLNTIGQFAITAAIDYGLAEFLVRMLGLPADRPHTLALCALILFSHAALNHAGVRAVAALNWFSAWYHLAGVALLVAAVLAFAPKRPPGFLFEPFTSAGVPYAYGFLVGLLQAAWTFTGYDASAHVSEETVDPTRSAPWGIVLSVAVSGAAGYVMLVAITLAIPDLREATADPEHRNAFIWILETALGGRLGGALVWMVMGAMWFCGLSSVTSNSRMLFAFARDGGLPASRLVARVSPRFRTPHVAIWVSAGAALLVALSSEAYSAMTALSTIALYASYAVPIALGLRARRAGRAARGPWHLGRFAGAVNAAALAWVGAALVLFVLPPNQLAGFTFAGALALVAALWFGRMRRHFAGPPLAPKGLAAAAAI